MHMRSLRNRTLAAAAVGALTITGTALAAHPKSSTKYGGPTSAAKFNGFRSQVTFKVSSNGKQLKNFTYQSVGCYGSGGPLTKGVNYLAKAWNVHKLGTVNVAGSGSFYKHHVITRYVTGGQTTTTISTVSGAFKKAGTATGTIRFSQSVVTKGAPAVKPCGPVTVKFTATAAKPNYGGY
jgi:hypothetical protein